MHHRFTYCLGACLLATMLGATAEADDVQIDQLWYRNVRVVGLRDGRLLYNVRGAARDVALGEVNGLRLDAHTEWQQADQAIEREKFDTAIRLLNQMAGDLGRRQAYLRPLVQRRLVEAHDRAGQFLEALAKYLELVREQSHEFFITASPKNLPEDQAVRRRATRRIAGAMDAVKPAARPVLEKLRTSLEAEDSPEPPAAADPADDQADGDASTPAPAAPGVEPIEVGTGSRELARIHRDLENGDYQAALRSVRILKPRRNAPLAELFYAEGMALAGLNQPLDAALAFMRVPVHFADSPLAVPAMIQAGRMLASTGKTEQARNVWRAAAERTDDQAARRQIARLLETVGG